MKMQRWSRASLLCLGMLLSAAPARGGVLFSEDFEGVDVSGGPVVLTTGNSSFNTVSIQTGDVAEVLNSPAHFGATNYLRWVESNTSGQSTAGNTAIDFAAGGVVQMSFDFLDPGTAVAGKIGVHLTTGSTSSGTARSVTMEFFNGNLGLVWGETGNTGVAETRMDKNAAYSTGVEHHLVVVGNYSATDPFNYALGTVGPQKYDVYIDGALVADDAFFRNTASDFSATMTDFSTFVVRANAGTADGEVLFDNFLVEDTVTVPEASSLAMAACALVGAIWLRKRA